MELGDFQGELDYAEDSLFQAGLLQLKSETRERKEILSFSDFSTQVNVGEKRIYIYSRGNMCARHWNGKIYRRKSGKCDSDRFAIELGRREVISAIVVEKTCISIIRQAAWSMMCLSLILIIFMSL